MTFVKSVIAVISGVAGNSGESILPYNCEYAREEILADSYVSVFNSHDVFIQINCLIWNHLFLGLFMKQKGLQKCI